MFFRTVLTNAAVSALLVVVGLACAPLLFDRAETRVIEVPRSPALAAQPASDSTEQALYVLQTKLDELLYEQTELRELNLDLSERLAYLEALDYEAYRVEQQARDDPDTFQTDLGSTLSPDQQELDMEAELGLADQHFENLADQVRYEDYDATWAPAMESSFYEIEIRTQDLGLGQIAVSSAQCGSQSCLVEFSHEQEIDHALMAGLLPVQGAREVVIKQHTEGGISRTQAVYLR